MSNKPLGVLDTPLIVDDPVTKTQIALPMETMTQTFISPDGAMTHISRTIYALPSHFVEQKETGNMIRTSTAFFRSDNDEFRQVCIRHSSSFTYPCKSCQILKKTLSMSDSAISIKTNRVGHSTPRSPIAQEKLHALSKGGKNSQGRPALLRVSDSHVKRNLRKELDNVEANRMEIDEEN